jgi:midasin (ATPase involved in ribosome maturation)
LEYESPLLNEVLFISNYMMVSFNTKSTPLMKMLTGMELLLEKLDEWQAYASIKLNSCHEEIMLIKQLIIRFRKIQILSWRNLLIYRKVKMIKDDFANCIRFIHTIERQIFDVQLYTVKRAANSSKNIVLKDKVELTIFELVDLFIRDSSLGLYESRLSVVKLLYDSFMLKHHLLTTNKKDSLVQLPELTSQQAVLVSERLRKVINILHFVLGYYS